MLEPFDVPQASVRSIAARVRSGGAGESEGVDIVTLRKLYRRVSARAAKKLASARTPQEITHAARAAAEVEKLAAHLAKAPAASSESRSLAADIVRAHRGGVWPAPELPEPVRTPPPEPEPVVVEPSPAEWIRQQVASLAPGAATSKPSERRTGLGCGDETVQSTPDTPARDKPLPEVRPRHRGRRTVGDASG